MKTDLTKDQEQYLNDLRACMGFLHDIFCEPIGDVDPSLVLDLRDALGDLGTDAERVASAENLRLSLQIAREALGRQGARAALGVLDVLGDPSSLDESQRADVVSDLRVALAICKRAFGEARGVNPEILFRIFNDLFVSEEE